METNYYKNKSEKLNKSFLKFLNGLQTTLTTNYGEAKAFAILEKSKVHYPSIITKMPWFRTPMYDELNALVQNPNV